MIFERLVQVRAHRVLEQRDDVVTVYFNCDPWVDGRKTGELDVAWTNDCGRILILDAKLKVPQSTDHDSIRRFGVKLRKEYQEKLKRSQDIYGRYCYLAFALPLADKPRWQNANQWHCLYFDFDDKFERALDAWVKRNST